MWIQDLREVCEKSFDNREAGQLEVESLREEWLKAFSEKEVTVTFALQVLGLKSVHREISYNVGRNEVSESKKREMLQYVFM